MTSGKHGTADDRANDRVYSVRDNTNNTVTHGGGVLGSVKSGLSGSLSGFHLNISGRSTNEEDVLIPRSPRQPQPQSQPQPQPQPTHLNPHDHQNQTASLSSNPLLNDGPSPDSPLGTNSIRSFHHRLNQNHNQTHGLKNPPHVAKKRSTKTKRKGGSSLTPSSNSYLASSRNRNKIVVGSVQESAASELEVFLPINC